MTIFYGCEKQIELGQAPADKRLSDVALAALPVQETDKDTIIFGFDLRSTPQEDARQYLPFLNYLEQNTGYKFKLRFTPEDGKIIDDLGNGIVHLAAIGAASYIKARENYNVIPLVRGLNRQGRAEYRSMLVVRPDSPINSINDLYGTKFAFGSKTSTQGHLIPRIILSQHGMGLNDFESHVFSASHQKCADAVISGRVHVCGLQDTMAADLAERKLLRILFTSNYFPSSGIVANGQLDKAILAKIKMALLLFDPTGTHRRGLYNWDKTEMPRGFVEAADQDYEELSSWMQRLNLSLDKLEAQLRRDS